MITGVICKAFFDDNKTEGNNSDKRALSANMKEEGES